MVRLLSLCLLGLVPCLLSAVPVATLLSLEGPVSVVRAGVTIPSERLADGFALEAFDSVSTGRSGRADVKLSALGLEGSVRLDSETSLYLDITPWKREQTAGIELLKGAVSVFLSSVSGTSLVEVRTEVGSFGGTAPRFRVVGSPGGDVLVVSEEGEVLCRVGDRIVSADPGLSVEVLTLHHEVRSIPANASTVDSTVASWVLARRLAFREQAEVYFRVLAARYQWQGGLFQRAWDRMQHAPKDDLRMIQAATVNLRRTAFPLERSFFRIESLKQLLDEGILSPALELTRGYTAKDFFAQTVKESGGLLDQLAQSRTLYRALSDRNGGDFPPASDGSEVTWNSDFFN